MNNMTDTDLELLRKELDSLGVSHSKKKDLDERLKSIEGKVLMYELFFAVLESIISLAFIVGTLYILYLLISH